MKKKELVRRLKTIVLNMEKAVHEGKGLQSSWHVLHKLQQLLDECKTETVPISEMPWGGLFTFRLGDEEIPFIKTDDSTRLEAVRLDTGERYMFEESEEGMPISCILREIK